ncbi:MAG TPA: hypothetical protein ENH63_06945 [Sulfitobacter litoralis]|jgi:hypothetical protein|uniref:Chromosomal replication initiator DnaA C-terminal domain-containing protein n=2 Tax=root TaxID=1 RepID=A0A7V1BE54_9RHOB|nr:hypothetical protein [Sulfitobacter litoralis]
MENSMPALAQIYKDGPFGNADTMISTRTGFNLRKNARLEEARDVCLDIMSGKELVAVARDTDDLMAYGVGSMIAKLVDRGQLRDELEVFSELAATFTKDSFEQAEEKRFNRRTVFEHLSTKGLVVNGLSIREAKPAGTLPTIAEISRVVENYRSISLNQIQSAARSRDIVDARFIAIWVMRYVCGHSLTYIGEQLGNRDHTSVLNGVNRIVATRAGDVGRRHEIDNICDESDVISLRRHHSILLNQSNIRRVI